MNDIKLTFKMIKYGYDLKMYIVLTILYYIFGLVEILIGNGVEIVGGLLIELVPLFLVQMIVCVGYTSLCRVSTKHKIVQRRGYIKFGILISLIGYILSAGTFLIVNTFVHHYDSSRVAFVLVAYGVINIIFNLYFALVYKFYVLSLVLFLPPLVISIMMQNFPRSISLSWPVVLAIVVGLLLIGNGLFGFITKKIYKCDYSKMALGYKLKLKM